MKVFEVEINDSDIEKVFREGVECCAEIEVGEACDCLLAMFSQIRDSELVQGFLDRIGQEHKEKLDKFLMLLLVSEIATLTSNFKKRERKVEAQA